MINENFMGVKISLLAFWIFQSKTLSLDIDDFSRDVRVVTIDNLTNQDKIDLENYVIEHLDKYTEIYQNVLRDNGFTAIFF